MQDTLALVERLRGTAVRIAEWREEAARLRAVIGLSGRDESMLVQVEQTAGAIYREIEAFDAAVAAIDRKSHAAAGEMAEVGDALRLVLMEITELGTMAYALDPATAATAEVPLVS